MILIWHVVGPIEKDFSVFCHLLDETNGIWGQADDVPVNGTMPALTWMAGEYIVDNSLYILGIDR